MALSSETVAKKCWSRFSGCRTLSAFFTVKCGRTGRLPSMLGFCPPHERRPVDAGVDVGIREINLRVRHIFDWKIERVVVAYSHAEESHFVLLPLAFNDGSAIPRATLSAIENEIFVAFKGWTLVGEVKGAYL